MARALPLHGMRRVRPRRTWLMNRIYVAGPKGRSYFTGALCQHLILIHFGLFDWRLIQTEVAMTKEWTMRVKFIHKSNADHYRKLLHTELSNEQLAFVERRLAQEQRTLRQLMESVTTVQTRTHAA